MRVFLRVVFLHLPPLRLYLGQPAKLKVVVYTDASYDATRQGLVVVVVDTLTDKRYICGGQVPPDLLTWITSQRGDLETQINQGELFAVVAAVITFPDILLKRDVVFCVYICIHTFIYMYSYIYSCLYTCVHTHIDMCIYVYINIHVYIYTHIYTTLL